MHALNEYYYVKGDPGDKVCFLKHIIKTSHGHINVFRASIKNLYRVYSTRSYTLYITLLEDTHSVQKLHGRVLNSKFEHAS